VALIEGLKLAPCHFVGLSMGGFVGLRLGARRPELVRSLAMLETSADPEPPKNARKYRLLIIGSRLFGVRPLAGQVMPILFGKTFMSDPARAVERQRWRDELGRNGRDIYRACHGVIERASVFEELGHITAPTLVLVGRRTWRPCPRRRSASRRRFAARSW